MCNMGGACNNMDEQENEEIEDLAKALHEAGREAVLKRKTVTASDLKIKTPNKFIEWGDLSADAKEGRRIQARYLLNKYQIILK